jgi:amino acid adenylation domain-containing protein
MRFEPVSDETGVDGIAVVGLSARLPGAPNARQFWRNLLEGVDSISHFSRDELEDAFSSEIRNSPDYVPARSILEDVDKFEPELFGMYSREAALTDPQQRVFLECCWEALEDAGYDPATFKGLIGVVAGNSFNTYLLRHVCGDQGGIDQFTSDYQVGSYPELLGALPDFLATRVCYKLNLRGPGINVQSACSTSLLAISQACEALLMFQSDMMLAGGVSITFPQKRGYVATEGAMVSPDGRCRPFDAKAGGTVFGSGAGVVLLKRLSDAIRDGDHIYGVIRGFGINNDGSGKAGFTAPSVEGQAGVIVQAHAMAGISARRIGYVECHGTATPLGDPIEFAGLQQAFSESTDERGFCVLGSAKANVGHLDAAAGVTGVIKALLTLQEQKIPPLLHYTSPNPHIDLGPSPFKINRETVPWPRTDEPRMAGVSAFGVGGTNVHLVIEEAPAARRQPSPRGTQLIVLSSRTPTALERMSHNLAQRLTEEPGLDLADVAWTLQQGRRRFAHRRVLVAPDTPAAIAALRGESPDKVQDRHEPLAAPAVHFLFPGQGTQHVGMGAELYAHQAEFRRAFDRCADLLTPHIGVDLRTFLEAADGSVAEQQERLRDTSVAQPAIFAIEYALARLWMSWGIEPKAMVGHSIGEFAAATVAGIFALEDVLAIVAARGRLMASVAPGGMLSVRLSEAEVLARLPASLSIAAINAPTVTVVAGPNADLDAFEARLAAEKVTTRRLVTSHAFHSGMMEPVVAAFRKIVEERPLRAPRIPILSTLTGTWLTEAEAVDPGYWARHLRETVRFSAAVAQLRGDPNAILLEVGPGNTLNSLARLHKGVADQVIASSLGGPGTSEPETETLLSALGSLWLGGIEPDWAAVWGADATNRRRVPLPTYPFERQRYWRDPPARKGGTQVAAEAAAVPAQAIAPASKEIPVMAHQNETAAAPVAAPAAPKATTEPRVERIRQALVELFEGLSDMQLGDAPREATFLEIGFDSLFLTQATRELAKELGLKVVFRQLLGELSTFDALARFADERLPADKVAAPAAEPQPAPVAVQPASVPLAAVPAPLAAPTIPQAGGAGATSALERIMRDQMQVMSQLFAAQIGALNGTPAAAIALPAEQPLPLAPRAAPAAAAAAAVAAQTDKQPAEKQPETEKPKALGPFKPLQTARMEGLNAAQEAKIKEIIARYTKKTAKSKALTQAHRQRLADPRVVAGFRENWKEIVYPVITNRSKGSRLWDVDGNEYIDMLNGFGPIMLGHRPDFLERAIEQQVHEGFEIGPQSPLAGEIAELFCEMTGNERMTFCNTGSEAVMAALRLARTVTGRDKVLTFSGDYHGMFDEVLIRSGRAKGGAPGALPIAPGIPRESVANMVMMDYGTPETLQWLRANADDLAAVMVEPFQSRRPGFIPLDFLREVREITQRSGTAFIFDEVVTGFRVHPGGAQTVFGIRADMATYGKVLGGGMPIGVLAGSCRFMDALDGGMWQYGDASVPEVGVTFFAGTFVRHPVTLAAVKAVLQELKAQGPALQERLTRRTAAMVARINAVLERYAIPTRIDTSFSVMYFHFPSEERYASLFYYLLREQGVHILEGFPCFMTTAHSDADIDHIVAAFERASAEMRAVGLLGTAAGAPATAIPSGPAPIPSGPVPMTEPQREIFLAAMLGDDASCAFNESLSIGLTGPLSAHALQSALSRVVERHDALRATVDEDGAHLNIKPELDVALETLDLSGLPAPEREQELQRLIDDDARTPFNLIAGPLVRGFLVRLAAQEHVLVLTMHHIVCDGWSCNVIVGELAELYSAQVERRQPKLETALSFAGYAGAEAREDRVAERATNEAYWRERFKDVPALIELPTDRPRGQARTFAGTTLRHLISPANHQALKRLGAKHGASLFATLFAGFNALVGRLSGQSDIVVGVPMAGQPTVEGGSLVGHCVSFLPLRTTVAENVTFAKLLAQTKDTVLDAYDHQGFTYGTLVQRLNIPRDPARLPLTELQFNLEQLASDVQFAGLASRVVANGKAAVNSDIFINIVERMDGLAIECDYNTDLYDASTIAGWLAGLEMLLLAAAANPDQPISELPLPAGTAGLVSAARPASAAARDLQRLAAFNETATDYPAQASIVELFEEQVAQTPDALALALGDTTMTYRELNARANRIANHLIALGLQPEEMVGCCLERSPDLIAALVGILKAGGAYVPLETTLPRERLAYIISDASVRFTLATDALAKAVLAGLGTEPVVLDGPASPIMSASDANPQLRSGPQSLAYVCYTSGSTGQPKGVMIEHRSVVRLVRSTNFCDFGPGSVLMQFAPVSFDASTLEIWGALLNGGRIAIVPPGEPSLAELGKVIREQGVTTAWLTAGLFHIMVEQRLDDLGRLRHLLAGGDVLSAAHVTEVVTKLPSVRMINGYGPTEGTTFTCCHTFPPGKPVSDPVPIGRPISNTRVYILDGNLRQVAIGEEGEICIGGDGLARGYLNNPSLTDQKLVTVDLGNGCKERLYRSGDRGKFLPDGTVQFLGRIDNQVKLRGFRIELGEIEVTLQRHPSVRQACVIAEREQGRVNRLLAFASPSEGSEVNEAVLSRHVGSILPAYMVPAAIVSVREFPLTANGKIDRAKLLAQAKASRAKLERVAPAGTQEEILTTIVKEVTQIEHVGVTDNLFELGVDSLKIFQITSRAAKAGIAIMPRSILQARSIRAALAHAAMAPTGTAAVPDIKPVARQRVKVVQATGANGAVKQ